MNSNAQSLGTEGASANRPNVNSPVDAWLGLANRLALQRIFRLLCVFVAYLLVVGILGELVQWSHLTGALLQFIPYCFVLAGVAYCGRTLAKSDKQTLLMVSCLVCVFIVFGLDVTKNLTWFADVPILGRNSRVRNEISSLAIVAALASFPSAGYLMIQEILESKRKLDEQVERLQDALSHVRRLQGLLPICMYCHKIKTDQQSWQQIELYVSEHSEATFTHGMCPECAREHFPEIKL